MQLAVPDVERDHARGTALQQHIGEPARGRAQVEAVEPRGSTANASRPCASLTPARETYGGGRSTSSGARVVDLLAGLRVPRHQPGHHEGLRLRPAGGETALDEQQIQPAAGHDVRAASPETMSASTEVSALTSARRAWARSADSSASRRAPFSPTSIA